MKLVYFLFAWACSLTAQSQPRLSVSTFDLGSVTTDLGNDIKVNPASSLHRAGYVIGDSTSPITLAAGVQSKYAGTRGFDLLGVGSLAFAKDVTALEVRFIILDVFGERLATLVGSEVRDFKSGSKIDLLDLHWRWGASENRVSALGGSIAFIARARLADGTVWKYDPSLIAAELAKIRLTISPDDMKPTLLRVDQ